MKEKLSQAFTKGKERVKQRLTPGKEKLLPYIQHIAAPVTEWGRKFERSFFATAHIARVFRKTLIIAAVFSGVGLAMGSISMAAFLATAKTASLVAGITWGREVVTRLFTDKKSVTWKNEIGQELQGTRIQKQRLSATQAQINRLTGKFNSVSGPTEYQRKKLKKIALEMQGQTKQVKVKSAPDGIAKDRYVFAVANRDWKPVDY